MPEDPKQDPGETAVPQKASGKPAAATAGNRKPSSSSGTPAKRKKTVQLGDFKLLKKLGQGGMGEVYLANQVSLANQVNLANQDNLDNQGNLDSQGNLDKPEAVGDQLEEHTDPDAPKDGRRLPSSLPTPFWSRCW